MSPRPTAAEIDNAVTLLASPFVIRLVTEIDDNGSVPPRRLAGTLPDLSSYHLRRATEAARAYGLVRLAPGIGLELTSSGAELADLYDLLARWARSRASPAPACDFSSRIRHTLDLVTRSLVTEHTDGLTTTPAAADVPGADAEAELARLRTLLIRWLTANPQISMVCEPEQAA
ncbi:regulator [Streptomyces sp. NPDC003435]